MPWPERLLGCRTGGVEVLNLHSPIAPAPELAKIRTHEAVAAHLATLPPAPRILCGDFNTPRRELPGGDVLTFAFDSAGRLRPERGERWDAAERALVHDLRARHGWTDAYRSLHGYGERSASWTFKDDRGGWRLDHVLVLGLDVRRVRLRPRVAPRRVVGSLGDGRRPGARVRQLRLGRGGEAATRGVETGVRSGSGRTTCGSALPKSSRERSRLDAARLPTPYPAAVDVRPR